MSPPLSDEQAARVERNAGLVTLVARRVARSVGVEIMNREELESVGNEALVRAAMRYDPSNSASFATFAQYRVHGAMIDAIRQRTPANRQHKRAVIRLAATQDLLERAGQDHAAQRAAGQPRNLEQRVELARELVRQASVAMQLAAPAYRPSFEEVAIEEPSPEDQLGDERERERLWALINELEPHEQQIIRAVYVDGRTMKDLATEIGMANSTVSRRHSRILDRLSKRIRSSVD